jgi:two-component sensor histidine kinase
MNRPLTGRIGAGMSISSHAILAARASVLELCAQGQPVDIVLRDLCIRMEALIPGAVAGVCILDRSAKLFESAIFPSLNESFAEGIKGACVAQKPGSCALAIYEGTIVTSLDIETDERFLDVWQRLNLDHGTKSIQSRPVFSTGGVSLGTFVLGFGERRVFGADEEEVAATGAQLAGIALSRHREEKLRTLVLAEMQHRTRNMFAMIGALVYSTLRAHPDPISFKPVFDRRLGALARAHSLGVGDINADLQSLLSDILAPHGTAPRIGLKGPSIILAKEAAAALALAANELATNATKYGALSTPEGHVDVAWNILANPGDDDIFMMTWTERGGPPVSPPARSGFGRVAIEQSLKNAIDGEVQLDFSEPGVICTIRAPLTDRLGARLS